MHTLLHYYYTKILYGEEEALISYAMDFEPAKNYIHLPLYREGFGSVLNKLCSLPQTLRVGASAHVIQDAYWHIFVRRKYHKERDVGWHRYVEGVWGRSWVKTHMPKPPEIDLDFLIKVLQRFGDVDRDEVIAYHEAIISSLYVGGWLEEMFPMFKEIDIEPYMRLINESFSEKAMNSLTKLLIKQERSPEMN